jgi:hypothetical protein
MKARSIRRGCRLLVDAIGSTGVMVLVPTVLVGLGYFGLFVRSVFRQPTLPHLTALLLLWQGQVGAAFALAAALIGAIAIVRQTRATEQQAEERRERRATALRAVLPLMLSELTDYARRCADLFAEVLTHAEGRNPSIGHGWGWPMDRQAPGATPFHPLAPRPIPSLPDGFVGRLTDLIETITLNQARPLVSLVKRVQIQRRRALTLQQRILRPRQGEIVVRTNVIASLIDAIEVHARCDRLFPYARGEVTVPPAEVSADDVQQSASQTVTAPPLLNEVAAEIDRYAATQASWPDQS